MAKRFTSDFYDINGVHLTVDIYDTDFVGTATEFNTKSLQINFDSQENDDPTSPIIGTRASVGMVIPVTDTTLTDFVEDFATSVEDRFFLEIGRVSGPDILWRGILVPDFTGEEDTAPAYIFNLSAVCGLGLLKKKPYHDGTAIYTGIDRFSEHLSTLLSKLSHTSQFWGGSDVFIKTAVDWWAVSMASGATDDAMYQGGVDHAAFYNYQNEGNVDKDVLSCYDVLWHILKSFECRIFQIDGSWWIEQIAYRTSSSYYTRHYSKTGGYLSNATNSGVNVIDQTRTGAKIATVNYDFLPALKKATVKYDVKIRRNYLNGFNLSSGGGGSVINFDQAISSNGGDAITRLKGTISYGIINNTYSGVGETLFLIPNFQLKIGANYLKRDYTISNFTANLTAPSWTATSGDRAYVPILLGPCPSTGLSMGGSFSFEILTPALPSDGDDNALTFSIGSISKWTGGGVDPTKFTFNWSVSDLFLEIYDEGTPIVSEDQIGYESVNPDNYTDTYETNVRLGTAILANSAGRIMRWNGSAWLIATNWGQGVDTRDDAIGDLLARNLLNARQSIRRRLNGTIFGTLNPKKLLSTPDGKKWMFSNIRWDLGQNTMDGTWFELNYGTGGVNSTPIKIKVIKQGPTFPPTTDPTTPSGLSNNSPGFNVNQGPTVLAPVAYNALTTAIAEGDTVTSIPIKTASLGNEFLAGDGVTLVNPYTGQFQTFEIASAPAFGATSLSVTSEAAANAFPEDSYLVVKQNAYAFSLPPATQGQILRYNDTTDAWEAYSGTTDGHVLTWDPTNGWQSEAASGGAGLSDADYGDITVSGTGTVMTIDNGVVTFAKFQDIATAKLLGRITAGTGDVEEVSLNGTLEFSGITLRRAALTGDVTAPAGSNATTIANNAVVTATIANDAVTLAKLQNAVAANIVLGNIGAAGAQYAELTQANLYTLLGMTGVANRLAIWGGTNNLASDVSYAVDAANGTMTIQATNPGLGAGAGTLNVNSTNFTGSCSYLTMVGNVSQNLSSEFRNTNTGATASTVFQIGQAGTGSGDPVLQFSITGAGGVTHSIGIDNSDGDKFKVTPNSATPGGVANSGLCVTNATIALVGINMDAPSYPLDVATQARAQQFMFTNNKPTAGAAGNGLGTGGSIGVISGADNAFTLPFTTGATGLTAGGPICTITYFKAWPTFAVPVFCQNNDAAGNEISKFVFGTLTSSTFELKVRGGQTLTPSTNYILNFVVGGQG